MLSELALYPRLRPRRVCNGHTTPSHDTLIGVALLRLRLLGCLSRGRAWRCGDGSVAIAAWRSWCGDGGVSGEGSELRLLPTARLGECLGRVDEDLLLAECLAREGSADEDGTVGVRLGGQRAHRRVGPRPAHVALDLNEQLEQRRDEAHARCGQRTRDRRDDRRHELLAMLTQERAQSAERRLQERGGGGEREGRGERVGVR